MAAPRGYISSVSLSSGQKIDFGSNDKVLIVGANNSGKSQFLRELNGCILHDHQPVVLAGASLEVPGTWNAVRKYVLKKGRYSNENYHIDGISIYHGFLEETFTEFEKKAGALLVKNISAEGRLAICHPQEHVNKGEIGSKPHHFLYEDEALVGRISKLFYAAFGKDLFLNYKGGRFIPLHVGVTPEWTAEQDRISRTYNQKVDEQPELHSQGDGMKSYAGILLESIANSRPITLLDEPEAFLHPPQMRRLGSTLASEVSGQLFCATHSSDILRGFLEATSGKVRIIRLRRDGGSTFADEADPSVIEALWTNPVLRYSNALEAIFHEQAVICEDDSDCRLYNAVEDHLMKVKKVPLHDTAYIPAVGRTASRKSLQFSVP